MRSSRICAILLVGILLTACGSVPRPFSPGAKSGGLPPPGPASALIVHPFAGTEGTPLEQLTASVIQVLQTRDVAAIPYEVANRYRMATQVDAVTVTGDRALLRVIVQFAQPGGASIAESTWDIPVSWSAYMAADPALIRSISQEVSDRMLATMGLADEPGQGVDANDADLSVVPIRRAPGDGAEALMNAMIAELDRLGLTARFEDGAEQLPALEAIVSVRPLDSSNDLVRIVWLLKDPTGRERGRLEQQNSVPTGRLNQRWGVVAQLAASAAAPGVVDLLRRLQGGG